jgi:hypothetical protein
LELATVDAPGFVAQAAEDVYMEVPARLFEWKKERGHYEGGQGFRGVSVRVPGTKAMRAYYGGLSQRRYVQGEENWKQTAEGTAVVTSKRIVFRGPTKNVEWAFAKLVGLNVDPDNSAMVLQVTNRQASHVVNVDDLEVFTLKVEAALAKFQGRPSPSLEESTPGRLPEAPPAQICRDSPLHRLAPRSRKKERGHYEGGQGFRGEVLAREPRSFVVEIIHAPKEGRPLARPVGEAADG